MLARCWTFVALLCVWTLEAVTIGQVPGGEESEQKTGEVEMLVLGPAGQPVARTDVSIASIERHPRDDAPKPVKARTDDRGGVVFPWPVDGPTMRISVKGVGFGLTGR